MAKFLLGLITGIFLCVFLAVLVVVAAASFSGRAPSVSQGSTLVLNLGGEIVEHNPANVPSLLFQRGMKPTVKDIHDILQKAAVDRRVNAVVLKARGIGAGWGKIQEIRADLEQFRNSQKPLIAFLETPGAREYYLATACDKIYVAPQGLLDVKGFRAESVFFKDTLSKLGVQADWVHVGKYKNFAEPFTQDKMSDATREVINSILDTVLNDFVATVAKGRHMTPEQVRAALDQGPFLPEEAVKAGLADGLRYEDQVFDEVKNLTKVSAIKKLRAESYSRVSLESLGLSGGSRIAVVYAVGDILQGEPEVSPFGGGEAIGSDTMARVLRDVGEDKNIKGVIVRIDSPGGDAFASDEIWRSMNLLHSKKPMVISMSDVAASGGYYMAMSGDPIIAYPGTYTGSIGVVFGKFNLHGLYDKLGVRKEILSRGKFADIDTDYRDFTPEEMQKVMSGMNSVYADFVQKVAEARKRKVSDIEPIAEGRVWLGSQAKQNGLIDELGGFDRAITLIKERAKLRPDDKVTLVSYPPEKKLLDVLLSRLNGAGDEDTLTETIRRKLGWAAPWRALLKGGMLKVAPYIVSVQ
ncbi:MAG TPA: signal peptide peptidase SppA [Bryobacterales bacterium]|jgi:protease-4|nr:signal peptide peptidase SppA [Bryobacterales bacterium]